MRKLGNLNIRRLFVRSTHIFMHKIDVCPFKTLTNWRSITLTSLFILLSVYWNATATSSFILHILYFTPYSKVDKKRISFLKQETKSKKINKKQAKKTRRNWTIQAPPIQTICRLSVLYQAHTMRQHWLFSLAWNQRKKSNNNNE